MSINQADLFVAAALQGLLAGRTATSNYTTEEVAKIAVECARYVLIELHKPTDPTDPVVDK